VSVSNPDLIKTYNAGGTININRLVKWGASDGAVLQSAAAADRSIGVALQAAVSGERVDVVRSGIAEVVLGGVVTRGDRLTADSDGKAIKATSTETKQAVINGGSAGNLTVTGALTTDKLVSVLRLDVELDTGTSASGNKVQALADITSEFTISAANTINNAGGTDTTGDRLLVTYERPVNIAGYAEVSGVSGDIVPMLVQIA